MERAAMLPFSDGSLNRDYVYIRDYVYDSDD
jgi:hypothetical protein